MSFIPVKRLVQNVNDRRNFSDGDEHYIGLEHISSWTGFLVSGIDTPPEGLVTVFKKGDILFGKLRPYLAKVAAPDFDGVCSTEALVLRPGKDSDTGFLRYCLSSFSFIDRVNSATFGVKMPRASWEIIGSEPIWAPDLQTQKKIATFLDRETARIDGLIAKKERLGGVIEQRRLAMITAAVAGQIGPAANEETLNGAPKSEIRLRYMLQVSPSAREIENLTAEDEVTFAPMDALDDGLGGLDASKSRPLGEVSAGSYNYFREGDVLLAKVTPCFENGKKALASHLMLISTEK